MKESVFQFAIKMPGVDSYIGVLASISHDEAMRMLTLIMFWSIMLVGIGL